MTSNLANRSPIYFTRAKGEEKIWIEEKKERVLTGKEAKDFYQSLIQENNAETPKERRVVKAKRKASGQNRRRGERRRVEASHIQTVGTSERDGHKLLRFAQEGNIQGLRDLLQRGCDVNFRDDFYWTGLMCASQAGKTEAVRMLLQHGAAWVGVVDKQGRDAQDLAQQAGHHDVVRELERFGVSESASVANDAASSHPPQWCSVCAVHYTDSTQTHNTSMLHQFSELRPPPTPHYCLPSSSTSYKMMLRSGWDPTSGLGPAHNGRKNPISTILKRDQKGLGYGATPQPKVTHFQAKDPQAVQQPNKKKLRLERGSKLNSKEVKRKEERDKMWERDFRSSFNFDL